MPFAMQVGADVPGDAGKPGVGVAQLRPHPDEMLEGRESRPAQSFFRGIGRVRPSPAETRQRRRERAPDAGETIRMSWVIAAFDVVAAPVSRQMDLGRTNRQLSPRPAC